MLAHMKGGSKIAIIECTQCGSNKIEATRWQTRWYVELKIAVSFIYLYGTCAPPAPARKKNGKSAKIRTIFFHSKCNAFRFALCECINHVSGVHIYYGFIFMCTYLVHLRQFQLFVHLLICAKMVLSAFSLFAFCFSSSFFVWVVMMSMRWSIMKLKQNYFTSRKCRLKNEWEMY